jgi:hypothetical protein
MASHDAHGVRVLVGLELRLRILERLPVEA